MKSIPSELLAHYRSGSTTLARLWLITRRDGHAFAFTDHDRSIEFDDVIYRPTSAFDASAVSTRAELNVDNLDVTGVIDDDGITVEDIEAGLWDGATLELREVNWADTSMGANILRVGEIGQVQRGRGYYKAELRGLMQKLQNNIGRTITPTCDATLGDARCDVDLEAFRVVGTVTAAVDRRTFTASGLVQPTDWFALGDVTFASGLNDGIVMEVKSHAGTGDIVLQLPMPFAIEVGDTFTIVPGCNKIKDDGGVGHCKHRFDNVVNFRGFSYVPGADKVLLFGGQ
jgi:uncharacterized phage protein (TIGR02218 family)